MTLQLLHGDCLELMKTLPDKSVSLFLCDLPYGCLSSKKNSGLDPEKYGKNRGMGGEKGCAWDVAIDLDAFWIQVKRLCKDDHTPIIMFCTTKFGFDLYKSNPDWFRYDLVWSKGRGVSFLSANKMPMRSHEMIYVFSKKGATYYRVDREGDFKAWKSKTSNVPSVQYSGVGRIGGEGAEGKRCVLSVIDNPTSSAKGGHPTEKPDDLYEWLITRYSKEGDLVLDPTAGSFSSCFTAQRLGRNAIGIEMDAGFYEKAKNRAEV